MTPYQDYIHLSRYARWREEDLRRETWEETVDRYVDFFRFRFPRLDWQELKEAIVSHEVMPSMRALMTAGPALERENLAGYNPVVGSTLVVTKEYGEVPINNLTNQTATVLNKNGDWTTAFFRSFGDQLTKRVVFKLNSNTVTEVECTGHHRWVLQDGTVKSTDSLTPGDRIDFVTAPRPAIDDIDYNLGVMHGIIYGDGTTSYSCKRADGYNIRLCTDQEDLLPYFSQYKPCYPPSNGGDPTICMRDGFAKTHALKELPPDSESDSYLVGFFRGWLAADGSVSKSSQVSICADTPSRDWLLKKASRLGYIVQSYAQMPRVTNLGPRKRDTWDIAISRSSLTADDFIIKRKRDRFRPLASHYVVSSVEDTGRVAEVFCAEVPETNTFVLTKGLVTGNCCYVPVEDWRVFPEILYILMCGTGVGFSVESSLVSRLAPVPENFQPGYKLIFEDSKGGWARGYADFVNSLLGGWIPSYDLSLIRPEGSPLRTFGGRASGPEPLRRLLEYTKELFLNARGRQLTTLEAHDLVCMIASCVVVGGVRRSALISLSDLSDPLLRHAKDGSWYTEHTQRTLANNSAVYTSRPAVTDFMHEWEVLINSGSGERGLFNRAAAQRKFASIYRPLWRNEIGTNPCGEILLRPYQLCNLTEVVIRPHDTEDSIKRKIRLASTLGTLQSSLTSFRFVRPDFSRNCNDEHLLGVSLTGIMDNILTIEAPDRVLWNWRVEAHTANTETCRKFGISPSAAITCVKPSGTVSQLVNSSSGIHPRWAPYYLRRVRATKTDPVSKLLLASGFRAEEDVTNPSTWVFAFPQKSPASAVTRNDISALDQLQVWEKYNRAWCDHNPSCSIYVRPEEWLKVGSWVYDKFDSIGGLSFFPHSDHIYQQAPNEDITEAEYTRLLAAQPQFNPAHLARYETSDLTSGAQELACSSSTGCEL